MSTAQNIHAQPANLLAIAGFQEQQSIVGLDPIMDRSRIATLKELSDLKPKVQKTFWDKLSNSKTGCKEYKGVKKDGRYGWMRIGSKCYYTHRISAWLSGLVDSPIAPKNQSIRGYVLHRCDNPACCNPEHLWIGNTSDNQLDCYKKHRRISPRNANFYARSHDKDDVSGSQINLF